MKFPKPLAVSIFSYCLVFTFSHLVAHAAEIEVAGYAKAVVTATRGKPMVKVSDGGDGERIIEVSGDNLGDASFEFVDFAPAGAYFGYGWYVENPGEFEMEGNGHYTASRYCGFDLAGGRSLVLAFSMPVMKFYNIPGERRSGVVCPAPVKFAVYSGRDGAFECAIRARRFFESLGAPSPGVAAKAGRFCVDVWNGSFKEHARLIREAAEYGLGDDLFMLVHVWQRHGYDRRLPDVWPPDLMFGKTADMKASLDAATDCGWKFGLHLNTVDLFPESDWYDSAKVCRDENGEPIKAWCNPYGGGQAYRLLHGLAADSIAHQLDQMAADGFMPNTMFVDVTGGAPGTMTDSYDADGRFHPMYENIAGNARMFDTLRETMARKWNGAAFTSSEGPCDFLVGHLDGGDCQYMSLEHHTDRVYLWGKVSSGRVSKVPWFPLVNHDRLILHGVGYSARFEGGRGELCHGIDSDDYISCEMMLGADPMADCYSRDARDAEEGNFRQLDFNRSLRQVVRKYWLEQPVARDLAMARVKSVAFADGNPDRVVVEWSSGMTVKVNRAEEDWTVDGYVLPQYGYRAFNPKTGTESKIYRHGSGRVVEESAYRDGKRLVRYASARGESVPRLAPLEPVTRAMREDGRVRVSTEWKAFRGGVAPDGRWVVSYWLADPKFKESNPDSFMRLVAKTESALSGITSAVFDFPADIPEEIKSRVALLVSVSPVGADIDDVAVRLNLLGTAAFYRRFTQGFFDKDGVYAQYECPDRALWDRVLPPDVELDFGWVKTSDGVRVVGESGRGGETKSLPRMGESAGCAKSACERLFNPGLDTYDFDGDDFKRLFTSDGWTAAILTPGPIFSKASYIERHIGSDELFALMEGAATLYVGKEMKPVQMERGRVYNVRRGTWHGIVVEPNTKVLVVENAGDIKTEKKGIKKK